MTPEHWKRVGELFEGAIEHEPAARADFLARAAAGDAALAEEVLRLLASDENAGIFLNSAAPLRDGLAWREANLDENSPMVAESLIALAECYLSRGERAKARPLVERAKRIHRSHVNLGEHLRAPLRKIEQRLAAR